MIGLQGKTALVTGGSSGIGQAIAVRLADEGVNVAINYVGSPEGAEMTREIIDASVESCLCTMRDAGHLPLLVEADVSNSEQVKQMFAQTINHFGGITIEVRETADVNSLMRDLRLQGLSTRHRQG